MITIDRRELQEIISHRNISGIEELSLIIGIPLRLDGKDSLKVIRLYV